MNNTEARETVKELMKQYDMHREEWVKAQGDDEGFNDWFTDQVYVAKRNEHIGDYEIRCWECGAVKYAHNVPRKSTCKACGCGSFRYEVVLPH
jgi:ribosomal protein L37E